MKVAIYCRLSEEDRNKKTKEEDSESIQNQKSMLLAYAMQNDWNVYNIYSDDDYTGSDRNRPAFNKLLEDAENKKFDIVLCKTQSRFTRELELVEKYIHTLFPIWNIRFISIVDNADTEIKGNKKSRQINGLINEWYLEDMSENIKSVLTNRRKNGFHIGAFALYGYKKDPNIKGHLIIDEEAAEIVREVYTLFSEGHGKSSIARMLNARGIPNPTEYKRQQGLRYKQPEKPQSTLWKYFAISDMLINEIYIGNMVQGKYGSVSYKSKKNKLLPPDKWIRVENTHEPIIDKKLWDKVQALVKEKAKPYFTGEIGIFARKTKCLHCGYTMQSAKHHNERYLKCPTRAVSQDACIGSMISIPRLEKIVLSEIQNLTETYLDKDLLEQKVSFDNRIEEQNEKHKKDIISYQHKIDICSKGIKDLYFDKTRGIISDEEFIELSKDFHSEKEQLRYYIKEKQIILAELEVKLQKATNHKELIRQYTDVKELNRDIIDTLIDYIEIGHRYEKSIERPINIYWNF